MSDDLNDIRETLLQIHGTVSKTQQSLDDHLKWSEKAHELREEQVELIDDRLGKAESAIHTGKFIAGVLGFLIAAPTAVWKLIRLMAEKFGGSPTP